MPHVQICMEDVQPCMMGQFYRFAASGHPIPDYTWSFHLAQNILLGGGSLGGTGNENVAGFSDDLVAGRPLPWSLIRSFRLVSPHSHLALQPFLWSPFLQIPSSSLAVQTLVSRSNASVSRQPTFPEEETAWSQVCCDIDRAEHFQSSQFWMEWLYLTKLTEFMSLPLSASLHCQCLSLSTLWDFEMRFFLPPKSNISYLCIKNTPSKASGSWHEVRARGLMY